MPLVDSEKWEDAFVSLNSLMFHPANPRFPGLAEKSSEREIIHELCERGKIEVIAKSISEKGYLRSERLIVFRDGRKNIVYEGNRRLCALKVLSNPELAPVGRRKTFQKLAEKASLPKKIAIDIVPTRFDAEVAMYAKHAGAVYMIGWKPIQQAAFIAGKLQEGVSVDEIARDHGIERKVVLHAQALIDLYRMCLLAPLTSAAQSLVEDPSEFPTSSLFERLVEPKKSGALLGFEITEQGLLAPPANEILPILATILNDIAHGKQDTRTLNSEKEQVAYVTGLKFSPTKSKKTGVKAMEKAVAISQSTRGNSAAGAVGSAATVGVSPKPKTRSASSSTRLFPQDLICEIAHTKLLALVKEGKDLVVKDVPNACAAFLRCTLDIALQNATDERKCVKSMEAKFKTGRDRISTAKLLEEAKLAKDFDIGLDGMEKRTIASLVSNGPLSYDALHLVVHSTHWTATKQNVIQLRNVVIPILRKALRKP